MTELAPRFHICWKSPKECPPKELAIFEDLVLLGNEVDPDGFPGRIRRAERLIFCSAGEWVIGVAGLKRPGAGYRNDTAEKSNLDLSEEDWPLEFGWVFVCPSARGHQISYHLLACGLDGINSGVFATSRADNPWIHSPMVKAGFVQEGERYVSARHGGNMLVFRRAANSGA